MKNRKEQEEAIKYFNNFTKYTRQLAKDEEKVNGKTIYQKDLEKRTKYFETVLNMLKDKEIEKKDKQIDLMAEYIGDEDITEIFCNEKEYCDEDCKQCVIQYFERKVEEC